MVSRTGRQLQRYDPTGCRLVVGCIPYRFRSSSKIGKGNVNEQVEVLVISSQKGQGMFFPKGGWELDESLEEAACRESLEEAGVLGTIEVSDFFLFFCELGKWSYRSRSHDSTCEGRMFPLLVTQQLDLWPEKNVRQRLWMAVDEASEVCEHWWMKEALDILVERLSTPRIQNPSTDSRFE
ncbi:Nudix hydrolase 17, mitochondrial [Ancistrocladus abbreviatus]